MGRVALFFGLVIVFAAAILLGLNWLPKLAADPYFLVRFGAGIVLVGGIALVLLSRMRGAPRRALVPGLLILGMAAWVVPLLAYRLPAHPPEAPKRHTEQPVRPERGIDPAAVAITVPGDDIGSLGREVRIAADRSGHFFVRGQVDGAPVVFLVDTGATEVTLSDADARRVGLRPLPSEFTREVRTAQGTTRTAPITLRELEVGPIRMRAVSAQVSASGLGISLLGMSFLSRLEGYSVRDGVLHLKE